MTRAGVSARLQSSQPQLTFDTAGWMAPTIVYPCRASASKMASTMRIDLHVYQKSCAHYGLTRAPVSP